MMIQGRFIFALVCVLALSGCTTLSALSASRDSAGDQLDFMVQAMSANPSEREALWQSTRNGGQSQRAELRFALMQSIPGHSGYDPAAARKNLNHFLLGNPSPGLASVARARIAELDASSSCRTDAAEMHHRVDQMVDIERHQDLQGH